MSLLTIIIAILAVGLVVAAVHRYAPIPAGFKYLIYVVAIGFLLIWLIQGLHLARHFPTIRC